MYNKPDHEWRTKFLLEACRVAITKIKNEQQVYFEAWNNGQVIERSITFKSVSQAKEFSYDLERLANEDPDMNFMSSSPQDLIIEAPSQEEQSSKSSSQMKKDASNKTTDTTREQDIETGQSNQDSDRHDNNNHNEMNCIQHIIHSFAFLIASTLHLIGFTFSLSLFYYAIAIGSVRTDPETKVAEGLLFSSLLLALIHGTGVMGVYEMGCGSFFIDLSCVLAVVNVLINVALSATFTVRKDDIFQYIKDHHDKFFVPEDEIDHLNDHVVWFYLLTIFVCLAEMIR